MGAMNMTLVWILIAVVVLALIVVGVVVAGNRRREAKTVSFSEQKELTRQPGEYQAKGEFNFVPAAAPEPVPVDRNEGLTTDMSREKEPQTEPVEEPRKKPAEVPADAPVDAPSGETLAAEAAQSTEAEEAVEAAEAAAEAVGAAETALEQTPAPDTVQPQPPAPVEDIAPAAGRIGRLRGRLSRSQSAIGRGLLGILTAGDLDEDAWEEIEDTLIMADLGSQLTMKVTESLREKIAERGVSTEEEARAMLRETLIDAARPDLDRSIKAVPHEGKPAVVLVVGVNGTGKTTTTGKLARVLVSLGHSVVLGAADTFRAAAADQLETWGRRVGATTVRGKEGADPASVAFDAVATGVEQGADVVLVDTAGRLHTATGLMDQLGKVKRVVEKKSTVDEVLLVLDATVGQNGIAQARVFREVVDITGVVLTKLDGTAKGGIVFQVQEELGVPVKLVGLGEGADDLAPFEVESFVDALLG
ncbi:Signal recognition particle receptor FtsY [Corynebacterium capitovis DSM 44611]|uniref:signal recognition particle-docking protein FtsY n=1 Tax=Corynebacterium capitovis TaxID=131081 RepID=UPI0003630F02|nr:signal recognition particle-docking protein FtsY [Corynebacterium capitovis]WKD57432.1 Signal recognition particle receptor FtsY [Corynebacterium capitovis DSM 44611]